MWAWKIGNWAAPGAVEPRTNSSVDRRSPRIAGILTHGSLPICTAYHNHAAAAGRHTRHGRYSTLAASATDEQTIRFASPSRCSWAQPGRQKLRLTLQPINTGVGRRVHHYRGR